MEAIHRPVLLKETIEMLRVEVGGKYIDATLGQAGHALEMVRRGGLVLGIEVNLKTYQWLRDYLGTHHREIAAQSLKVVRGNFVDLFRLAESYGFEKVDGILFDLGLSSFELRESGRGFSFASDEPLDMRLDPGRQEATAADLLNRLSAKELYGIFTKFGEERDARRLAAALVRRRSLKKFKTSFDLVSFVESAYQQKKRKEIYKHLAKMFLALRIAVNDELEVLSQGLRQALRLLQPGGRICVISFHSLEDRVVKRLFLEWQRKAAGRALSQRGIVPGFVEVRANPAARSSRLRAFELSGAGDRA